MTAPPHGTVLYDRTTTRPYYMTAHHTTVLYDCAITRPYYMTAPPHDRTNMTAPQHDRTI